MAHPNLKTEDPTLLKITTKDHEVIDLKHKTEKHNLEVILRSIKSDNDYYRKKIKV